MSMVDARTPKLQLPQTRRRLGYHRGICYASERCFRQMNGCFGRSSITQSVSRQGSLHPLDTLSVSQSSLATYASGVEGRVIKVCLDLFLLGVWAARSRCFGDPFNRDSCASDLVVPARWNGTP